MKERYTGLDGMRGIFALIIVLFHLNGSFGKPFAGVLYPIYQYGGYLGNYFFFFVSGFLISYSYREKIANHEIAVSEYLFYRLIRLYPIYILGNLWSLALSIHKDGFLEAFKLDKFLATLLMVNSGWFTDDYPYDYPLWFFSVLLLCYLLYFAVAKFAKGAVYPVLLLIMIFGGRVILLQEPQAPFLYRWNGEGMFNFFLGALIQIIVYRLGKEKAKIIARVLLALLLFSLVLHYGLGIEVWRDIVLTISVWIIPISTLTACYVDLLKGILSTKPLAFLGKISIFICAIHIPLFETCLLLLGKINLKYIFSTIGGLFLYLVMLIGVSGLLYYLIEVHFIRKIKDGIGVRFLNNRSME